jgi:hypothetical protein
VVAVAVALAVAVAVTGGEVCGGGGGESDLIDDEATRPYNN